MKSDGSARFGSDRPEMHGCCGVCTSPPLHLRAISSFVKIAPRVQQVYLAGVRSAWLGVCHVESRSSIFLPFHGGVACEEFSPRSRRCLLAWEPQGAG